MSLQNPAALWGLLALTVPVLIHLLNASRGRTLRFGDIRFIGEAQAERLSRLFPNQLLLLALRCLLLGLIVVLLAGPRWSTEPAPRGDTVVLISPLALNIGGVSALETARDIARSNNSEVRVLAKGFPTPQQRQLPVNGGAFSLLAELDRDLATGQSVVLLVADDPRESGWRRPELARPVEWAVVAPGPETNIAPVEVALMAASDRQADLGYVRSALESLVTAGVSIEIIEPGVKGSEQAVPDVLIALGAVDGQGTHAAGAVLVDGGDVETARSRVLVFGGAFHDIRVGDGGSGETVIAAVDGTPVVRISRSSGQTRLVWTSRFHPEYASLVAGPEFPDLLERLIEELAPAAFVPQDLAVADGETGRSPGLAWLSLLIALLWLVERWFSERSNGRA